MLNEIKPTKGSVKSRKRIGRGDGSGRGTFCGKGVKGQKARSGRGKGAQFEGGQTPLIRRQPKRGGFSNPNREEYEVINLDALEKFLDAGSYDITALIDAGIVRGKLPVKVLGRGEIKKKFNITVNAASKTAKDALAKAGGSVTII